MSHTLYLSLGYISYSILRYTSTAKLDNDKKIKIQINKTLANIALVVLRIY